MGIFLFGAEETVNGLGIGSVRRGARGRKAVRESAVDLRLTVNPEIL